MDVQRRLQINRDALLEQYFANLEDVYNLQDTLIQSILPSVTDELGLGLEAQKWAKEWLCDTPTMFRISRRNRFTRSFCLEAVQRNLLWRFQNLWPLEPPPAIPNLHCLPVHISDPLGRPILVLRSNPMDEAPSTKQNVLVHAVERLRLHLKQLYDISRDDNPTLQYVVLLDLSELSFQSIDINLFTWIAKELTPRFPGMIGAVFMLNYTWTHSGIWGVIKRLLPEAALSRIFFPSNKELIECLTPSALPQEFGGSLPSLFDLEDPLRPRQLTPSSVLDHVSSKNVEFATAPHNGPISRLSSTSSLNPFYGYPVAPAPARGVPALRFGRRRKRDLIRTLAKLFWLRWHDQMNALLCLGVIVVLFRFMWRKGLLRLPRGGLTLPFFGRPSAV